MYLTSAILVVLCFSVHGSHYGGPDPCYGNPCGSGGQCYNRDHSYTCVCVEGYKYDGGSCVLWPCYGNPCGDYGSCRYKGEKHWCECLEGYQGEPCVPVYDKGYDGQKDNYGQGDYYGQDGNYGQDINYFGRK